MMCVLHAVKDDEIPQKEVKVEDEGFFAMEEDPYDNDDEPDYDDDDELY